MFDTSDKQTTIFYSLAWFGFLPLLVPLYLLPAVGDLMHYFVGAYTLSASHGMFLHYRVALAVLLVVPTIMAISKYKKLNRNSTALVILVLAAFFQYSLHLPVSYLAKKWFWTEPASVKNINAAIAELPKDASLVSQNNITPHVSHRDEIFTLFPTNKESKGNWFRWAGNPQFLIVDTSGDWDARGFLTDRESFTDGLKNMEKAQVIKKQTQKGDTVIYQILKKP